MEKNKYRILFITELILSIIMISNIAFAKYTYNNEITVANVDIEQPKGVYVKFYDTDNDGIGETLVFNNTPQFTYQGNMISNYNNIDNNVYQKASTPVWRSDRTKIKEVVILDEIKPKTTKNWFSYASRLERITNIENLNTSMTTNIGFMFSGCIKLSNIDVSHFNTSSITDMSGMFNNCYALEKIDLSTFDTSNVINMTSMFANCRKLTTIYTSDSFIVSQVVSSDYMFTNCELLVGGNGIKYDPEKIDKQMANYMTGYFTNKFNNQSLTTSDIDKTNNGVKEHQDIDTDFKVNNIGKNDGINELHTEQLEKIKLPRTGM